MMELDFEPGLTLDGDLVYRMEDHAFDFYPASPHELDKRTKSDGTAALGLSTLQIEVAVRTGLALFPWGYQPRATWIRGEVQLPSTIEGGLVRVHAAELSSGVTLPLTHSRWSVTYDENTRWIQIGSGAIDIAVEFAAGSVAGLGDGTLQALWLKPLQL